MNTLAGNFDFDSMVKVLNLIQAKGTRLSLKRQQELIMAMHFLATESYTRGFEAGQKYSSYQRCIPPPPNDNKYHFDPFPTPISPIKEDKFHPPEFPHWDANKIWCDSHPNLKSRD